MRFLNSDNDLATARRRAAGVLGVNRRGHRSPQRLVAAHLWSGGATGGGKGVRCPQCSPAYQPTEAVGTSGDSSSRKAISVYPAVRRAVNFSTLCTTHDPAGVRLAAGHLREPANLDQPDPISGMTTAPGTARPAGPRRFAGRRVPRRGGHDRQQLGQIFAAARRAPGLLPRLDQQLHPGLAIATLVFVKRHR
jgi:hypothetical protein